MLPLLAVSVQLLSNVALSTMATFDHYSICPIKYPSSIDFPKDCRYRIATDPNHMPRSGIEDWFSEEIFNDLFPRANHGLGPSPCLPFSYASFIIAARYFPKFGTETIDNGHYSPMETRKRDVAAFFAHVIQETGENDIHLYNENNMTLEEKDNCFYRGGLFLWSERRQSLNTSQWSYRDHIKANQCHRRFHYCARSLLNDYWFPCNDTIMKTDNVNITKQSINGCYFGRGALQLTWNYNYGQFQDWLKLNKISVDLLNNSFLILTKRNPPLSFLASLWFYMTPQPPKPSMHNIIIGKWQSNMANTNAGFIGPIFGPTSLVISNECTGEEPDDQLIGAGRGGENRRIKAFKWLCKYFGVEYGDHLSCQGMPDPQFTSSSSSSDTSNGISWAPLWRDTWLRGHCDCEPVSYPGPLPYYRLEEHGMEYMAMNERNKKRCVFSIYDRPDIHQMTMENTRCLRHRPFLFSQWSKDFFYHSKQ